jgi:hypothetical protein
MLPSGIRVGFRPCSYEPKVFSPRIRALLPAQYLSKTGVQATVIPPGGEGEYDCAVFQKAYAKRDLALAEALKARGARLIFDLCDNHFYNPTGDPAVAEKVDRLKRMLDLVDAVTVSSPEIAKLITSKPTFQCDDALELLPFTQLAERLGWPTRRLRRRLNRPVRLVWHGQSGTEHLNSGVAPVGLLLPELEELHRRLPLSLTIVSNSAKAFRRHIAGARFHTRFVTWRAQTFAPVFAQHDICILPIEKNEFTICKTNNRAMTSLLLGVPVVAEEIPSYREFAQWMRFGDWSRSITEYAERPDVAAAHVRAVQAHIARTYTEQRVIDQWSTALEAVLSENVR